MSKVDVEIMSYCVTISNNLLPISWEDIILRLNSFETSNDSSVALHRRETRTAASGRVTSDTRSIHRLLTVEVKQPVCMWGLQGVAVYHLLVHVALARVASW